MNNNIFVSIASYRDDVCINTLNSLYENAKYPFNIFIGICQQNNNNIDIDILYNNSNIIKKYKNNIRIIRIPYYDAKGPVYARYLCSSLLDKNNEKFYFQIDSHTIFIKNWDIILIDMIYDIISQGLSKKPVISYYPKDILIKNNNSNIDNKNIIPIIYNVLFNKNKKIFILGQSIYTNTYGKYIKTPFATAGMFFCFSSFLDDMPFDPTLDYLFNGEEILNSIKFYTNGYDIFSPNINIIYHEYSRNNKPKYWNEPKIIFDDTNALNKVRYYLFNYDHYNKNPYYNNYKLGNIRTINDFYKFANIDINYYRKFIDNNYYKKKLYFIAFSIIFFIIILCFIFYFEFLSYLKLMKNL